MIDGYMFNSRDRRTKYRETGGKVSEISDTFKFIAECSNFY